MIDWGNNKLGDELCCVMRSCEIGVNAKFCVLVKEFNFLDLVVKIDHFSSMFNPNSSLKILASRYYLSKNIFDLLISVK